MNFLTMFFPRDKKRVATDKEKVYMALVLNELGIVNKIIRSILEPSKNLSPKHHWFYELPGNKTANIEGEKDMMENRGVQQSSNKKRIMSPTKL